MRLLKWFGIGVLLSVSSLMLQMLEHFSVLYLLGKCLWFILFPAGLGMVMIMDFYRYNLGFYHGGDGDLGIYILLHWILSGVQLALIGYLRPWRIFQKPASQKNAS